MISKDFWKISSERQCSALEDFSMRDFKLDLAHTRHKYKDIYLDFSVQLRRRYSKARSWRIPTEPNRDHSWDEIITKKEINAYGALQWKTQKESHYEKMLQNLEWLQDRVKTKQSARQTDGHDIQKKSNEEKLLPWRTLTYKDGYANSVQREANKDIYHIQEQYQGII